MEYLTRWRTLLAGDKLTNSGDPISVIALSLSYDSESAFSKAFRRFMGCSPRQYRRSVCHSFRSATIGSTPAARVAGITDANSAATHSSTIANVSMTGSHGLTPNS
jgi:AraC-like DNA-binding protein